MLFIGARLPRVEGSVIASPTRGYKSILPMRLRFLYRFWSLSFLRRIVKKSLRYLKYKRHVSRSNKLSGHICKMHLVELEEEDMNSEERELGVKPRPVEAGGIEACRPRNWLVPVILVTLREWNSYGYELMERLTAFGFETMNPGTLYRTLRQMEKDGVVKSDWETSQGGPARRVYSITDAGEAYLDFWARSLEQYRRNMDTFFQIYREQAATKGREQNDE